MTEVSKKIRESRQKLGLSAKTFAKLIGSNVCSVYNWENNRGTPRNPEIWKRIDRLIELFDKISKNPDILF
ncbi:MAG: helix-turn-helix domain-containing protein [Acutalibacteraceae bacterium]|nr:helix-turn-helix domain-containing protein [Acutalibacteraceae bacterium]